jgi:elongation factor P
MNPGKGSAIMRVKYKSLKNGNVVEFTHKTTESVEEADIDKVELAFSYFDGQDAVFIDVKTYEQTTVSHAVLAGREVYLIPDLKCWVLLFENQPIDIILPPNVALTVTESQDAVAGNRVNAPKKEITVETGLKVQAPLFIKEGEKILVSTADGSYVSRAN